MPEASNIGKTRVRQAWKVTWVGFIANAFLAVLKIIAGITGRSSAMIADGFHSMSDFITDVIVLVSVGIARKKADIHYQYGHGKYETFATLMVAVFLGVVAVLFFTDGVTTVWATLHGNPLPSPRMIALIMAVVSIVVKEWLYRYTVKVGRRINSSIIIANAWHHRSDAFSSLATLLGIAGAMFLGPGWRILDPLASMVVSVLILIVAVKLARPAVIELLDGALPEEVLNRLHRIIGTTDGVLGFHRLRSRRNGSMTILELHIKVDPMMTVEHSHDIATEVERKLMKEFHGNAIITTHIEPYHGETVDNFKMCIEKN